MTVYNYRKFYPFEQEFFLWVIDNYGNLYNKNRQVNMENIWDVVTRIIRCRLKALS